MARKKKKDHINMWSIYERMAEIQLEAKTKGSEVDIEEMHMLLEANLNFVMKVNAQKNLALAATMVNDIGWLHECCAEIEKLKELIDI